MFTYGVKGMVTLSLKSRYFTDIQERFTGK
jgi:hypothetical protein